MKARIGSIAVVASVLAAVMFALPVAADMFQPSHYCSKPRKPIFGFSSEWEVDSFAAKVRSYKECISSFVSEQNAAAERHRRAADEAIDEWNHFVRYELR